MSNIVLNDEQLKWLNVDFLQTFDSYCWIAGGAITHCLLNCRPNDIDIFFDSKSSRLDALNKSLSIGYEVLTAGARFIKLRDTKNIRPTMISFDWENNLTKRDRPKFFDLIVLGNSPDETIRAFDFSINQVAIDKNNKTFSTSDALDDILNKRLIINGQHPNNSPVNKAKVILKNLRKGFTINNQELSKIFPSMPENINSTDEQIMWLVEYIVEK